MTERPLIFVSHASVDADLAKVLGEQIESVLGSENIEVFVSSNDDAIDAGTAWFERVVNALQKTEALVVLLTPNSVDRRWVWFEVGYIWRKMDAEKHIYPLAISSSQSIPHPLNTLQAKFLDSEGQIKNFFDRLCAQFGFGVIGNANLSQLVNNAKNSSYYPRPSQLSDDERREILREHINEAAKTFQEKFNAVGEHLFTGKLIRFDQLDKELELPIGSSKAFLIEIADEFGLAPQEEHMNTVRLRIENNGKLFDKYISQR